MTRVQALRLVALLAAMFGLGLGAILYGPEGGHIGYMWPVGLATGVLILVPRRLVPILCVTIALLATASFAIGDFDTSIAAGFGLGIALEALVTQRVITVGWSRRWSLAEVNDLGRYALACTAGALVGALVFAGVAQLNDFAVPWRIGVATFTTHLASQAVLVALFRDHKGPRTSYGATERILVWSVTLGYTVVAFIPTELPSLAFLIIPLLGWVAFRAPTRESLLLLVAVASISSTMSNEGLGPFSDGYLVNRLDPEFRYLPQQSFLIACAMVTIPFSMAVAMQRWSALQALRERARSELLVQSARGIAIIGTDRLGRINLFSPGAVSILGFEPEEVYGQSTRMFHTEAELARHAEELGSDPTYVSVVQATGQLPPGTARVWQFVRKDGIPRTLSTILSPVTDDNGDFIGYVATADDITDRIDAEAALEKALRTERRAVRRLTEIDQVKDAFVSSVSHELRTPITNIVGYLELMMDGVYGEPSARQADAMARIDMNSRRLLTLIDDLLTLSSMESIDHRRRRSQVDLGAVVRRAEEIVRPSLDQRDLRLDLELPAEPVTVVGDAGELERLVINLATNAVKFTPDGGRIVVRLLPGTGTAGPALEVVDTGIGIHAEDKAMLFTRFFRTSHAHELGVPGSGLGLSIAKAIADVHGGTISAESVHGAGSTFRVDFPESA
ncbi:PAS domain S-box protein [Nocardioides marmoriginsengisoli]|uniref:histidine kinase n=1 Tax=Nocardioides marmoriginsengisoli TaxID=661483 RepID=A0A3N0CIA3_9ACTN|nr:ATP-binding protein [Nocardioides marmoriginsengisoli]RNL63155.1 PAS domain S-box protein [Nocardioides marmoriginsengisoli]